MQTKQKKSPAAIIGFLVIALFAIYLALLRPLDGLDGLGHITMAATLITVALWIFRPCDLPNSVSGLFLLGVMCAAGMPAATVFNGFSQGAEWTLIAALFFGKVLIKTGLGRRIALGLIRAFPANWPCVMLVWALIGLVLSLVTPSITVRVSIMLPIALSCCTLYELPAGSKSSSLLLIHAMMMGIVPGNGWLTGGLLGPMLQGIYETVPGLQGAVDFSSWLQALLLPTLLTTVFTSVLGFFFLRPEVKLSRVDVGSGEKLSRAELISAVILLICCVLFFLGGKLNISSAAVCLIAAVLFFVFRILEPDEFTSGVNWDLIIFIGVGMCMSGILAAGGVSDWLSARLAPLFIQLVEARIIFVLGLAAALFLWRFIDVTTLLPTTVILAPTIAVVAEQCGLSPMIWISVIVLAACSCFLSYTNMWAMMGKKLSASYAWSEGHISRYGLAYFIAALLALCCTIPYWNWAGLL